VAVAAYCKFITQRLQQFQCAASDCNTFLPRLPKICIRNPIPASPAGAEAGAGAAGPGCCTDNCCSMAMDNARVDWGTASANASLSRACAFVTHSRVRHSDDRIVSSDRDGKKEKQIRRWHLPDGGAWRCKGSTGRSGGGTAAGCCN
jgi:hypothetical protein